jgi:poly(A) polymerase
LTKFTTSFDLPDDCFDPGEVKPARPQKKKAMNGTTKKRSATEVCELLTP